MKVSNLVPITVSSLSLLIAGCAKAPSDSLASALPTSVVMTSSTSTTKVAKNEHPLLSFLLPSASALMPTAVVDSTGAAVTLSNAWIALRSIKFKMAEVPGAEETDTEDSIKFKGPYFVDLLSTSPAPLDTQALPAGAYRRIEFDLHKATSVPTGVPSQLVNHSIYLVFGVNGHVVTFQSQDGASIRIAGPTGLQLDGSADMLISLRLTNIFAHLNLSSISANITIDESNQVTASNPCPLIDASSTSLYSCLRKGLEKESKLAKDTNHDGEVGSSESEADDQ